MKRIAPIFLFVVLCCSGNSLPIEKQAAFFSAKPAASAPPPPSGFTMLFHSIAGGDQNGATNTIANTTGATLLDVWTGSYLALVTPTNSGTVNTYVMVTNFTVNNYFVAHWICASPTVGGSKDFWLSDSTGHYPVLFVSGWTGNNASPIDVSGAAGDNGSQSTQPGAITPGQDNSLVMVGAVHALNETLSIDSPFGVINQANCGGGGALQLMVASNIQTTATSCNPTVTCVTGEILIVAQSSLKP